MKSLTSRHVLVAALIAAVLIAVGTLAALRIGGGLSYAISTLVQEVAFLAAAFAAARIARVDAVEATWIRRTGGRDVSAGLLIGLGVMLFSTSLVGHFHREDDPALTRILEEVRRAMGTGGFLLVLGVFAPVCEEVFFRGVVFQGMRKRLRTGGAIAGSAALFGLMHGIGTHGLVAAFLGVVCAVAVLRSRSLVTSMMVHSANNLAALGLSLIAPAYVLPLPFAIVGIALGTLGFVVLRTRPGAFAATVALA